MKENFILINILKSKRIKTEFLCMKDQGKEKVIFK